MAKITQVGPGRKTVGTIDGITYVTRGGVTYARSTPTMPASVYNTPAAKKRQAIFKMVQIHLKFHLRTIRQTFTPKGIGTPSNRYYSLNGKALTAALDALADLYVAGEDVTLTEIEAAICAYAAEHPTAIRIASKSGYQEVFLTGEWPDTITLRANGGDSTVIIIVAENGVTTTISPDGSTSVSGSNDSGSNGSGTNTNDTNQTNSVAAPTFSGATQFTDTTQVTMSGPAGASIFYTLDGTTPTDQNLEYEEPITLSATTTVKAIAIKDGVSSSVTSRTYTKGSGSGGNGGDGEE